MILLTAKEQEVHVVVDVEFFDVRSGNDDVGIASKLLTLRLDVTERSRNRQSAWEHTVRSIDDVGVLLSSFLVASENGTIVLSWLVRNGLNLLLRVASRDGLCLIHPASI